MSVFLYVKKKTLSIGTDVMQCAWHWNGSRGKKKSFFFGVCRVQNFSILFGHPPGVRSTVCRGTTWLSVFEFRKHKFKKKTHHNKLPTSEMIPVFHSWAIIMQKLAHNGEREGERERERDHCKHFPMNHVGEKICLKKRNKKSYLKKSCDSAAGFLLS